VQRIISDNEIGEYKSKVISVTVYHSAFDGYKD